MDYKQAMENNNPSSEKRVMETNEKEVGIRQTRNFSAPTSKMRNVSGNEL